MRELIYIRIFPRHRAFFPWKEDFSSHLAHFPPSPSMAGETIRLPDLSDQSGISQPFKVGTFNAVREHGETIRLSSNTLHTLSPDLPLP